MKFETLNAISELEKQIFEGYKLPVFEGYVAVNKRGVEKFIDAIYASLPEDVARARKYLNENAEKIAPRSESVEKSVSIYDSLKELETKVDEGFPVLAKYMIIKVNEVENLLNKVRDSVPEVIKIAESSDK